MNYQVLLTSRAQLQLLRNAQWWSENRSTDQAARWLDGFEAAIAGLAHNPHQHRMAPESNRYQLPFPARQLNFGIGNKPTHRAVFEVRGDTVYVVAIRHLAQDDLAAEELS
jgi:plasmid stabilization system protein ParE